jgi:hypothetical protein
VENTARARTSLWEKAIALPLAQESDFYGANRRPHGVDPQHLRIIKDTALRSRLIMAGMAEGLQSPKGPQKIASILRLYADFNAPPPTRGARTGTRRQAEPVRSAYGLPSVEELNTLLHRITVVERAVSSELQGQINNDIARLKAQIATLEGDEFERAFRELDRAVRARREVAGVVREETFKRIEADSSFEPRKYLRLISRDPHTTD